MSAPIRTSDDLPADHWMKRQLLDGVSLRGYAEDVAISNLTAVATSAVARAGLSHADVAKLLEIPEANVTRVLNGSTALCVQTLAALLWCCGKQIRGLTTEPVASTRGDR